MGRKKGEHDGASQELLPRSPLTLHGSYLQAFGVLGQGRSPVPRMAAGLRGSLGRKGRCVLTAVGHCPEVGGSSPPTPRVGRG